MREDLKKRVLAGSMAVALTGAGLGAVPGSGIVNEAEAKDNKNAKETEDFFKEESVYVKADPSGNVTDTTVTEWLKNPEKGSLKDETNLNDIKNVKGDETFSEGKDNEIKWKSEGKDIYYQGTSDEKLPVGVKISYKLNGKSISAEELNGKSGKVEIQIDYDNDSKQIVEVGSKKEEMYTPFTMITAMMLSTDEYTNVEIDHGKVISDGDKNIVVGMGFPGLKENLDLEETDFDVEIPDSVKITADVKNASVGPTITMASCELISELDLDDVDSFDELEDSMDELEDAASQLVDGSKDAKDGADQLKDGAGELKDGTDKLSGGSGELSNGSKTLAEGSKAVAGGIDELSQKSGSLITGVNSLAYGVTQYTAGVSSLKEGSKALYDGAAKLQAGIAQAEKSTEEQLVPGAKQIMDGAQAAENSVDTMAESLKGVESLLNSTANVEVTAKAEATATATATAEDVKFKKSSDEIWSSVQSELPDTLDDEEKEKIEAIVKKAVSEAQEVSAKEVTVTETATDTQTKKIGEDENYQTAEAYVGKVSEGASELNSKMAGLSEGAKGLYGGLSQLQMQLANGNDTENPTIADGVYSLTEGTKNLYQGAAALVSKNDALNLGTMQLKEGGAQLSGGVKKLSQGAKQVSTGASSLSKGAKTLDEGIDALDEGAGNLFEGTKALAEGITELSDGMSEFKEEGIDKLSDAFNGDFKKAKDRLDAMADLGKAYKSYAGIKDGVDGSTKFIIETVGIEEDE
ncbi:MAG: hypothetical protein ACI4S2_08395 [Lachnospiraceae bacterium]